MYRLSAKKHVNMVKLTQYFQLIIIIIVLLLYSKSRSLRDWFTSRQSRVRFLKCLTLPRSRSPNVSPRLGLEIKVSTTSLVVVGWTSPCIHQYGQCSQKYELGTVTRSTKAIQGVTKSTTVTSVFVSKAVIQILWSNRSFGVTLDQKLSFDQHVNNTCKSCYHHSWPCDISVSHWPMNTHDRSLQCDWFPAWRLSLRYSHWNVTVELYQE